MPERIRAAFYRGGTSKAVVFNGADLPADRITRDRIFLHVLGSPDGYGRQLNGMGGGLSSLSKVVIVEPSKRADADVDYTFVQVAVDQALADYGSACGNMSSCVGPFAIEEGMLTAPNDQTEALVRIFNTNTDQIYHARFPVKDGLPVEEGDFTIAGVTGGGAKIALNFLSPSGAATGKLLPTGQPANSLYVGGLGTFPVSIVDAANPVIYCYASDLGKTGLETPQELDADSNFMANVERMRCAGAVAMGLAETVETVAAANPKIALVSPPGAFTALDGRHYDAGSHDINVRLVSMNNFHRAITLTGGMCTGVAAGIPGTIVADIVQPEVSDLRIGTPSGVLPVTADVRSGTNGPEAISAGTFRTQRRIMEGAVLYPASILNDAS